MCAGCAGRMRVEFGSEMLYLQLLYLKQLFDIGAATRKLQQENADRKDRGLLPLSPPVLADDDRVRVPSLNSRSQPARRPHSLPRLLRLSFGAAGG